MANTEACVLKTDGINCEEEMSHAFHLAGALPEIVHVNQLRSGDRNLNQYGILALPGGFSYGDDVASGRVLATELTSYLSDQLQEFVDRGKPILGVCNGFQVLVRTGLLPNQTIGEQQVTLAENAVGRFECRWIELGLAQSVCKFVKPVDFEEPTLPMQIAHGEGRFFGNSEQVSRLAQNGQIVFRYVSPDFTEAVTYPDNPNGSVDNIAGICDPSGLVLGMMPHPERSLTSLHPHRERTESARRVASSIFNNIVNYAEGI